MKKEKYLNMLQTNMTEFVNLSGYSEEDVIFQQYVDRKHTAKILKDKK